MSRSWWKNRNSGMMKMTGGIIRLKSSQPAKNRRPRNRPRAKA